MATLKLKTDIACGGCVSTVKPALDADPRVAAWSVDTTVEATSKARSAVADPRVAAWSVDTALPDKVLTVERDDIAAEHVAALLGGRGFHVLGEVPPAPRRCCCG